MILYSIFKKQSHGRIFYSVSEKEKEGETIVLTGFADIQEAFYISDILQTSEFLKESIFLDHNSDELDYDFKELIYESIPTSKGKYISFWDIEGSLIAFVNELEIHAKVHYFVPSEKDKYFCKRCGEYLTHPYHIKG